MLSIDCAYVQKNLTQVQSNALMAEGNPKSPTKELSDSDTS